TLIPAVLTLMPKPKSVPRGRPLPKPVLAVLRLPVMHRWSVLGVAAAIAVASAFLVPSLRFNPDPLDLRDPKSEAVRTLRDLAGDRTLGRSTITALIEGREQADELKRTLADHASIERVITLDSFVPAEQQAKLDIVAQLRGAVSASIGAGERLGDVAEPPATTVTRRLDALRSLGSSLEGVEMPEARRLRDAVSVVVQRAEAMPEEDAAAYLDELRERLLGTLPLALDRLERALSPRAVTLDTLPDELASHWVRGDTWRVEVLPSERFETVSEMRPAVDEVRQAAGAEYVTGGPVLQIASADAIVQAFRRASVFALIGITLVLLVRLRSLWLTALVLVPLALGGVATGAFMVLVDMPLNFANVIALPLLLGIGVDNGIHMVHRREHGMPAHGNLLETTTARAVLFSALTTLCSFGNLAISPHPGMASMGIVLSVGVVLMLGCTLILLPAFFGIGRKR
ncbi:MAG: MMPL family transporter, partial [Phycisphaeraceae bacterium]